MLLGAQGDGIYIVSSPDELRHGSLAERQLVQEYIADPYLLADGLKFDFRVYAVIKSINPLSIYIAREGTACFMQRRSYMVKNHGRQNLQKLHKIFFKGKTKNVQ